MNENNKKTYSKAYEVGKKIGLNEKDVDDILININASNDQSSIQVGPPDPYIGGFYGTMSFKDFQ